MPVHPSYQEYCVIRGLPEGARNKRRSSVRGDSSRRTVPAAPTAAPGRRPVRTDRYRHRLAPAPAVNLRRLPGVCQTVIARSLATEADVLVLDEPTASLDPDHALAMYELLKDLSSEGKAVALALHDLNAAHRWADNAVLLEGGRLQACGSAAEVLASERLGSVFDVEIERQRSPRGVPTLVFHRRKRK